MPQLSVILTNYNHSQFLPECLDAILSQSFKDWELITIDDCSTDNSVEVINEYQEKSSQIKLYENVQNLGPVKSYNKGFNQSQGDFIFFAASDDMLLPGFFEKTIAFLTANPHLGLCTSCCCNFQNQKPYVHYTQIDIISNTPLILSPNELITIFRKNNFLIPGHATIYKRELVQKYGVYKEVLHSICDWYLNLNIALNHSIGYLPYFLSSWRIIPSSYSSGLMKNSNLRTQMFANLFTTIRQENTKEFNRLLKKSTFLIQLKTQFLFFCMTRPRTWPYLFPLLLQLPFRIFKKLSKKTILESSVA